MFIGVQIYVLEQRGGLLACHTWMGWIQDSSSEKALLDSRK